MEVLNNHYQVFLNGNKLVRNYKNYGSAVNCLNRLASDRSNYVELWFTDSDGKRTLLAYEN